MGALERFLRGNLHIHHKKCLLYEGHLINIHQSCSLREVVQDILKQSFRATPLDFAQASSTTLSLVVDFDWGKGADIWSCKVLS